ncbi:AAA family ATPase [Photobacterium ganghwense]|uniref:ATPase n=1 Tax=Photobacterium ganghwense TaxID=320778 RepID=A0A0J1H2V8_9GAMM|nr:AAA family ATPase [Photobacterium ganghwense]KLV06106.1 ATPase [Photobacterium ganghwense]MBV1840011.1 AAA family ATPase [Photobacterium ganghwense]PSU04961.1 ATPase [Photobacterium ganghwense]
MQPIIITGGPGAGKTTLLQALAQRGYLTYPEVSRALIREESARDDGILPWTDLPGFAALCLDRMSSQREQAACSTMPAFVDRAIGDICAYLKVGGLPVTANYLAAAKGYHSTVFFCAPEASIYVQDDERPHNFAEAQAIHRELVTTYQALGYAVAEVPWGTVEARANWVLARLRDGQIGE